MQFQLQKKLQMFNILTNFDQISTSKAYTELLKYVQPFLIRL